mmetsp:Transcript_21500/g.64171  ORF Transcript_21500/g.64171 Transcript_21500/m.64171 type:complete len:435 (+) Transcript_21500:63-1367(+)
MVSIRYIAAALVGLTVLLLILHVLLAFQAGGHHSVFAAAAQGESLHLREAQGRAKPRGGATCSTFGPLGLFDQAESDFARYRSGLTPQQQAEYQNFCEQQARQACMTIVIAKGRIYVRHFVPGYQSRHRATLHAIYRVAQRFGPLPDAQFVVEVTDGYFAGVDLPVFMITRMEHTQVGVLYPDFTFYTWPEAVCPPERSHAYGPLFEEFAREARSAEADPEAWWKNKADVLFWRGGVVSSPQRAQAMKALQGLPGVDVAYMEWHNVSITGHNGAPGCVGLRDHCRRRYLAFLNGNTYSSRLKYQLLCGSCVFASRPQWIEWWSRLLSPKTDYLEVRQDWSDAAEKLAEVRARPDGGHAIAEQGRRKALAILSEDAVDCYWLRLIEQAAVVLPPPSFLDEDGVPRKAMPIEDVLLYPNNVILAGDYVAGPVELVR